MSLGENLKNILKNKVGNSFRNIARNEKSRMLFFSVAAVIILCIIGISIALKGTSKNNAFNNSVLNRESESLTLEMSNESSVNEELENAEVKKEYDNLYADYENALKECNEIISEYNLFQKNIEEYSFEGLPTHMDLIDSEIPSFDQFYQGSVDRDLLVKLTEDLNEKKAYMENTCADVSIIAYNVVVNDYNKVLNAYQAQMNKVSLDYLQGVQMNQREKNTIKKWIRDKWSRTDAESRIRFITNETHELAAIYLMALQIENPNKEWVMDRLLEIDDIVQREAVTKEKDPNGLLSLDGGYTSCIYFTTTSVKPGSVKGMGPVEKGVDGGGAIEVYATIEDAKCRCDYLGKYDGTLLYSGSYAILGTMVIRTSYQLDNEEQIELTNKIMQVFTELK